MADYYNRLFELFIVDRDLPFISATDGRQFKITFDILLEFGGMTSYADIAIYNLSRDTEALVFRKGDYVGFSAGYVDSIDSIFKGEIVNILREKQVGDTITRLICKGGTISQQSSTINTSFEGGASIVELIKACASALGFPLVIDEGDFPGESPYISGYHLAGDPKTILNKLARSHHFQWLIESEKLVVVGDSSFRKGDVIVVSSSTGLIGVPEITEIGSDVLVKLNPALKIGGRFELKSELVVANFSAIYFQDFPETIGPGVYNIDRLQFEGDSYGDVWDTKITSLRRAS